MKKISLYMLLTVLTINGFGQSSTFLADRVTGNFYRPEQQEVQGTPLLMSDWVPGVIYLRDGYKADKFLLNLDLYSNQLVFQHDGNPLVVVNPVKEVVFQPAFGNALLFRCGYLPVDKNTETTLYQVLQDGPTALLKVTRKFIKEVKVYNQNPTKEFDQNETYYIVKAGKQPEKIKRERNSLIDAIGDGKGKLLAWAEKNKLKCKSEEDMKAVVKAFNENTFEEPKK